MKTNIMIQYAGEEVSDHDLIVEVKKIWLDQGRKINEIKTLDIYVKPEESKAYYVINDKETGELIH